MKAHFVIQSSAPNDATAWHADLPRAKRVTLRLTTKKQRANNATDLTETLRRDALIVDATYNQNLEFLDRGYDFDEFGDIDNEFEGLTITEPMDEAQLIEFCTGYNIL